MAIPLVNGPCSGADRIGARSMPIYSQLGQTEGLKLIDSTLPDRGGSGAGHFHHFQHRRPNRRALCTVRAASYCQTLDARATTRAHFHCQCLINLIACSLQRETKHKLMTHCRGYGANRCEPHGHK